MAAEYRRSMKPDSDKIETQDVSWPMLLTTTAIFAASLHLLAYNVIYTEGEVIQTLFWLLVVATVVFALIGFYRRRVAMWGVVLMGGMLLLWQAYQLRTWAKLHEEVITIIRFAEESKEKTGNYPHDLANYNFEHGWVKSHICRIGTNNSGEFGITYFMNNPGTTYWYSSKTGFGYYPD